MSDRRAFTLIEMIACLALIALAAGAAVLSLRGRSELAALDQAKAQLSHADHMARHAAQRTGQPVQIVLDLDHAAIMIDCGGSGDAMRSTVEFPAGVQIARTRMGRDSIESGRAQIPCSIRGQTPSYAVLLNSSDKQRQWLLVAGLTGQIERFDDERQVQNVLQMCQSAGSDAD